MRKTLIPLMLTLAAAAPWALATANDDGKAERHRHRAEHKLEQLLKTVEPTDAQRTQIEAIHAKYEPQMKSLHDQIHALHKQMKTEVSGVLTAEQREKLEKEEASHHRHRHHKEG